jgi:hypothetical protein
VDQELALYQHIRTELVFRGAHQKCTHTAMKSEPFRPNSFFARSQGSRPKGAGNRSGSGGLFLGAPLLNPVARRILRVLRPPVRLCPLSPRRLALRLTARALAQSYPWVRTEPVTANRAGSFPKRGHRRL